MERRHNDVDPRNWLQRNKELVVLAVSLVATLGGAILTTWLHIERDEATIIEHQKDEDRRLDAIERRIDYRFGKE